jgi:glyoxylase-like metal-dependent hydrolase (beta-lactamase superfamily II)
VSGLIRISESVFCVQRKAYLSCSYFVVRDDGVVLVDAGMDASGNEMAAGLAEAGHRVEDVLAILLTHWHNDHSSGAARLQERSGAKVYYHAAGEPKYTRRTASRGFRGWLARLFPDAGPLAPFKGLLDAAPPYAIRADQQVREGDVVEGGFLVLETPGHDAGHVSYWFEKERVLFAGDALAVAGDHVTFLSRWLTQDLDAARRSMIRCLDLEPRAICPGHRHPLVDPDPARLRDLRDRLADGMRWPIFGA